MTATLKHMLQASLLLSYSTKYQHQHFATAFHRASLPTKFASSSTTRREMSDNAIIALNVKAHVKPEFRQGLLQVLTQDAQQSRTVEPGCLQFMVGVDVSNENVLHLHDSTFPKKRWTFTIKRRI